MSVMGSLLVFVSGPLQRDAEDMAFVVPFQVPQDQDVYVVASTVFGAGRIAISQTPIDESPEFHKRKRQEKDAADDTAVPATAEALPPG
ncbi:SPSB1 [Symbiodinium natans]|uniref:SPSB1 protein n=1 Tax=Symbiodinium natans TaxID=878477 RepID=A0A812I036_9DINO|nr:SPSB1 [Symbiodinium natans]